MKVVIPMKVRMGNFILNHCLPQPFGENYRTRGLRRTLTSLVNPGDLVYDIGANNGSYTKIFLDNGNEVVSVEPGIEAFNEMNAKFITDYRGVWTGYYAAVTNHNGTVDFNRALGNKSSASSIHPEVIELADRIDHKSQWVKEKVRAITLNQLIKENGLPELCKIDTEGHEPIVLSTLKEPINKFIIEVWEHIPGWERTFDILASLGEYKFNYQYAGYYDKPLSKKWLTREQMLNHMEKLPDNPSTSYQTVDIYATLGKNE